MAQPSVDRLALLYRVSQTFNSSLDLDEVLNRVMDEVIAATQAERGFLMLREADGSLGFRAARGMDQQTIDSPEFQVSRSVVERVVQEERPLLTDNAQDDVFLGGRASIIGLGLRSILCVPLQIKGAVRGIIYVDNRLQAGIFTQDDLELLTAIASSAAIAIENARLYQVAVEKGRMERELQVAREVQASLIPRQTPQVPKWELAARWQPAREVSGDFYDFIPLGRPASEAAQPLGVVIADVSDKGMPAALFMALTRSIVRASVSQAPSPAEGIAKANHLICADAAEGMFVTLFYTRLDPVTGRIDYVNAGHDPPLLYQAQRDRLTLLERTGMILGIDDNTPFEQGSIELDRGDFLLLYTDGITDATDLQGEAFGRGRLQEVIRANRRESGAGLVQAIEEALRAHAGPSAPFDDVTMVALKRL